VENELLCDRCDGRGASLYKRNILCLECKPIVKAFRAERKANLPAREVVEVKKPAAMVSKRK
jgi:hypothetical protein